MAQIQAANNCTAPLQLSHMMSSALAGKSDAMAFFLTIQPQTIAAKERTVFLEVLRNTIKDSPTPNPQVLHKIISLCLYLADWPLLIQLSEQSLYSPTGAHKATPYIQMGKLLKAQQLNTEALQKQPDDLPLIQQQQLIIETMQTHPYMNTTNHCKELWLTPLEYHHVADFGWQYCDPDIAALCNLPVFPTAESWLNWLHYCQQDPHLYIFAIIHRELGFIGSTCLHIHQGHGFFYYWLGADFRGKGFGPRAVTELLNLGNTYFGMQDCFTKVFKHNQPSQRATRKAGFRLLPFSAQPPSDNETFYYCGKEKQNTVLHKQLGELLLLLKSEIELVG